MVLVSITGGDRRAMAELVTRHSVAVVRQTLRQQADGWAVAANCTPETVAALRQHGYRVDPHPHPQRAPVQRPAERALRERPADRPRRGPGSGPDGYLSVSDVETGLTDLAAAHPRLATLIELPHRTWEGQVCRALRIGPAPSGDHPVIVLLAGVHAREWGGSDILIAFTTRLLRALATGRGVAIGSARWPAGTIRRLAEATIIVVPQVNPDGRRYSQEHDPQWRKNRRPPTRPGAASGVDVNRNFDVLWDFRAAFAPHAPVASSTDPGSEVYIGPDPASEPETANIVWLLDTCAVSHLVDLHSFGELVLYSWGDDTNQSRDPSMSLTNPAWNGHRGMDGDTYGEFIRSDDEAALQTLATAIASGIRRVSGRTYRVQQSMDLYPTSGTCDDYAFSRHVTGAGTKTLAFTIEWGAAANPTPFHPPYPVMASVIREVCGGLFAFCAQALHLGRPTTPH